MPAQIRTFSRRHEARAVNHMAFRDETVALVSHEHAPPIAGAIGGTLGNPTAHAGARSAQFFLPRAP